MASGAFVRIDSKSGLPSKQTPTRKKGKSMANVTKTASAKLGVSQERVVNESFSRPKVIYGPANPHPLSQMKTELVWDGKYDEFGNLREVDITGLAMPLQRIETVDDPRSRAVAEKDQPTLFSLEKERKKLGDFRNMLIWGENKLVMASLLKDFKGEVDLIYIDPPFDVGADFTMDVPIGDEKETIAKDQSTLEFVAYRDMWGKGTDSYLSMMYERLKLMRDLLSPDGSIYVHCDWRLNSSLRLLLDEVFGPDCFRNEITWRRQIVRGMKTHARFMAYSSDYLLLYTRSEAATWNPIEKETFISIAEAEQKYMKDKGGYFRTSDPGTYSDESIIRLNKEGRIHITNGGKLVVKDGKVTVTTGSIGIKYYREQRGNQVVEKTVADNIWDDIPGMGVVSSEYLGYATQKPKALLRRVIEASSNEGDLVVDFFCGSGTTGAMAEWLGRRWIMADLGRFAIHTSRKRLLEVQRKLHAEDKPYRAFDVYNLGRYERQWWQKERLKGANEEHRKVVMEFYRATPLSGSPSPLLHGRKDSAFVHVDSIDGLFTQAELRAVAEAVHAAGAREIKCLAWDFEMDLRLHANAFEAELGVKIALLRIPREIMEKNRTEVPFFEIGRAHV